MVSINEYTPSCDRKSSLFLTVTWLVRDRSQGSPGVDPPGVSYSETDYLTGGAVRNHQSEAGPSAIHTTLNFPRRAGQVCSSQSFCLT